MSSHGCFSKISKKINHRNDKYEINLSHNTLKSQIKKGQDALAFKFYALNGETSDETLKMLVRAMKSFKRVRKIDIDCQSCPLVTDEGLKILSQGLNRLNSLICLKLNFNNMPSTITEKGISSLGGSLKRLSALQSISLNIGR